LDEQVDVRLVCLTEVGCYSGVFDRVQKLFLLEAQQVHGHGAGHQFHALLDGGVEQLLQRHGPRVLYDHAHHLRTHTGEVHL
jgi:hypothetical protein